MAKGDCILPSNLQLFENDLSSGKLNAQELIEMGPEARTKVFNKYVGSKQADFLEKGFSEKLLLKRQKAGLSNWAKSLGGLNKSSESEIRRVISNMNTAHDPDAVVGIVDELTDAKLGIDVSKEEVERIVELTDRIAETSKEDDVREWGKRKVDLILYMREITPPEDTKWVADTLGIMRTIQTGFEASMLLRQGHGLFHTKEWRDAAVKVPKFWNGESAMNDLLVDIYGNKHVDNVLKNKNALGLTLLGQSKINRAEEASSKWSRTMPYLSPSVRAYEGFLNDLRLNMFVNQLNNLEKSGALESMSEKSITDLAEVISASTGRGSLGKHLDKASGPLAAVFFSPKWAASKVRQMMNPITKMERGGKLGFKSTPASRLATKSIAINAGSTLAVLGALTAAGADVEWDLESTDFGSVRIGNTRMDLTGGWASWITLMARMYTMRRVSASSGKATDLNRGYWKDNTRWDLAGDFIGNKSSPAMSMIATIMKGGSRDGNFFTETGDKQEFSVQALKDNPLGVATEVLKASIIPMIASDGIDAFIDGAGGVEALEGYFKGTKKMTSKDFLRTLGVGSLATIGAGVGLSAQTFPDKSLGGAKKLKSLKKLKPLKPLK